MTTSRTTLRGVALAIFAATVWLYWPSVNGEILMGDDTNYLQDAVRLHGLTWDAVKWAFTEREPYYHPLARLSHLVDYQLWGADAAGHHETSVLLHALNAVLVFGFLWTLLGAVPLTAGERLAMAAGVAVVFAIHPIQTESVAWISGRTQVMCATFGIACLWAYVAGARWWVVLGLFVAALLCKPMAVSFPFVMLAIDYYPLRRYEQLGWGRLLRQKAVLMALGVVGALATLITGSQPGGLMVPIETVPPLQRVYLMFQSLVFYPWKLVWSARLLPFYPLRTGLALWQWPTFVNVCSVAIVAALVAWNMRRLPALMAGWCAYIALVLPVSGLVQSGTQALAARYAYVAMLPLLLLAGGVVVWAWRRSATVGHLGLAGVLTCEMCVFGVQTRGLIPVWHDSESWARVPAAAFPDSELANRMLADALVAHGKAREALEYAQRDVRLAPQRSETHVILATALSQVGKVPEAIEQYEQALRLKPDYAEAHYDLGIALLKLGRAQEAMEHWERAVRINPDLAEAHYNLGNALLQSGKVQEAISQYEQALRIMPDLAEAHYNLGVAFEQAGQVQQAIQHYQQALRINPDFAKARNALARAQTVKREAELGGSNR